MKININWEEFREKQREPAAEAVRGALALDEVARREHIAVSDEEIDAEVERYAERSGRGAAAVRADSRKRVGLHAFTRGCAARKTVEFLLSARPQRFRRDEPIALRLRRGRKLADRGYGVVKLR